MTGIKTYWRGFKPEVLSKTYPQKKTERQALKYKKVVEVQIGTK